MRRPDNLHRSRAFLPLAALWIASVLIGPAVAQTWPAAVDDHVAEMAAFCTAGYSADNLVRIVEINEDGKPDYFVDDGAILCDGEGMPPYCGASGSCSFTVFVSSGKGFERFDYMAQQYDVGDGFVELDGERFLWNGEAFEAE